MLMSADTTMTREEVHIINAEVVLRYHQGNVKEKNRIMTDVLDSVRPMLFSRHYSFSNPEDRLDVMQEFRIGVMDALRDYDATLGCSFFTYLQYKLRGAFTRWRYYQSELIRTKDNYYKTKLDIFSLDAPVHNNTEGTTYTELVEYDDQKDLENSFKHNMPSLGDLSNWADANLKDTYAIIFKQWITYEGNMVRTADHIGVSRQYIGIVLKKIFKKMSRAYARTI
jgi:hypothetical protein